MPFLPSIKVQNVVLQSLWCIALLGFRTKESSCMKIQEKHLNISHIKLSEKLLNKKNMMETTA